MIPTACPIPMPPPMPPMRSAARNSRNFRERASIPARPAASPRPRGDGRGGEAAAHRRSKPGRSRAALWPECQRMAASAEGTAVLPRRRPRTSTALQSGRGGDQDDPAAPTPGHHRRVPGRSRGEARSGARIQSHRPPRAASPRAAAPRTTRHRRRHSLELPQGVGAARHPLSTGTGGRAS